MPLTASKSWRVFLSPFFSATSMYSGQLEMISFLVLAEMSVATHFAGSCFAEGVSKRGSTARLPIPNAAIPPALRNVRLLGPAPGRPDPVETTRTPPVSQVTLPPHPASRQGIPLCPHADATETLRGR